RSLQRPVSRNHGGNGGLWQFAEIASSTKSRAALSNPGSFDSSQSPPRTVWVSWGDPLPATRASAAHRSFRGGFRFDARGRQARHPIRQALIKLSDERATAVPAAPLGYLFLVKRR